jgi:TM2 domain-containing membrane protein YozV
MKLKDSPNPSFFQQAKTFIKEKKTEAIVFGLFFPFAYDLLKGTSAPTMNQTEKPTIIISPKRRTVYIILGLLFGCLGIHNFYAGRNAMGAFQLILCLLLFWTIIIPFGLVFWSVVEVCTVKRDGNGIPMR